MTATRAACRPARFTLPPQRSAPARDLLQSHFAPHRSGARVGNSGWALVIVSPPVARAQLSEIASIARQSAAAGEASLRDRLPAARDRRSAGDGLPAAQSGSQQY